MKTTSFWEGGAVMFPGNSNLLSHLKETWAAYGRIRVENIQLNKLPDPRKTGVVFCSVAALFSTPWCIRNLQN